MRILKTIEKITNLIKRKKITEKKFLDDLGFTKTTLSNWKSGQNSSYKDHIVKIANYFEVTTDYLLKEDIGSPTSLSKNLKWSDLDVSFYEGVDNLTDEEKKIILNHMNFLVSERKKNQDQDK